MIRETKALKRPPGLTQLTRLQQEPEGVRGPCWIWLGRSDKPRPGRAGRGDGYGRIGTCERAHRVVYTILVGPVPRHLDLDHLCNVRLCVNPEHCQPVTHRENARRRDERMALSRRST